MDHEGTLDLSLLATQSLEDLDTDQQPLWVHKQYLGCYNRQRFRWYAEHTDDVLPVKLFDGEQTNACNGFFFYSLGEIFSCYHCKSAIALSC